jgi:hypothetical protein
MERDLSPHGADARKPLLATLCAAFDHAVATSPHKVALRHFGVALTYRELGRAVTALAMRLASIVAPGEVMALVLPNSIEPNVPASTLPESIAADKQKPGTFAYGSWGDGSPPQLVYETLNKRASMKFCMCPTKAWRRC